MIRTFIGFLPTLCLALTVSVPSGFAADDGFRIGLELRPAEIQIFPSYLPRISNIPTSARMVPIHSGDPGAGTLVLIQPDSVQPGSYIPFSAAMAPEIGYRRLTFRGGAIFSLIALTPRPIEGSTGSTQEYNYLQGGNSRGYGAALVYYAGVVRPSTAPGAFGELEVRAGGGLSAIFGYQRSQNNVDIQQGWDRYDSLQTYQRLLLSSDVLQQPYAGFRWTIRTASRMQSSVFVYGGPALVTKNPTPLGKTAVLQYSANPFFVGAGMAFQWDWHSKPASHAR